MLTFQSLTTQIILISLCVSRTSNYRTLRKKVNEVNIDSIPENSDEAGAIIASLKQRQDNTELSHGAVLAVEVLNEFNCQNLVPTYLSSNTSELFLINNAYTDFFNEIKNAYTDFINDADNTLAQSMIKEIINNGFTVESFIKNCMETFHISIQIRHSCVSAFRLTHSFRDYLIVIKNLPKLSDTHFKCLEIISKFIKNDDDASYFTIF